MGGALQINKVQVKVMPQPQINRSSRMHGGSSVGRDQTKLRDLRNQMRELKRQVRAERKLLETQIARLHHQVSLLTARMESCATPSRGLLTSENAIPSMRNLTGNVSPEVEENKDSTSIENKDANDEHEFVQFMESLLVEQGEDPGEEYEESDEYEG